MKVLSLLLSCIFALFCFSCHNSKSDTSVTICTEANDKPSNPFLSQDELLFYIISDSVYHNLKRTHPSHPRWGKLYTKEYPGHIFLSYKDYAMIDSMARVLYSPNNFSHTSDSDWEINATGLIEYLNWKLWTILEPYIGRQWVVNLMEEESVIIDSLLSAQQYWFRVHFDTTQELIGSSYNLKYHHIKQEMRTIQNQNMKELLQCLSDTAYISSQLPNIPNSLLKNECQHISNHLIPYYKNDSVYSAESDREAFLQENRWWGKLMRIRKKIRNLIREDAIKAFDNGSNRLMFNRLRQLKNEFEAYKPMSGYMRHNVLSDSCTYEELLAYPNFSTKWNEYQNNLND